MVMTLFEQLEQIELHLETCVQKKRFDTFNQLMSDRLRLLKKAIRSPEKDQVFALARKQTDRWVELLKERVEQETLRRSRARSLSGYSQGNAPRAGRVLNRYM